MMRFIGLDRILPYKARPNRAIDARLAALQEYHRLLASLAAGDPALHGADELLDRDLFGLRGAALKAYEDEVDGLMCAYVAHYLWRWGMARARVFGSLEAGSITSPVPRDQWREGRR